MFKIYIKTFGCQMNDRDSEALAGLFKIKGYSLVDSPDEADVVLVNTCSVRDHAENRALSFLGSLKKGSRVKGQGSRKIIGLLGCMAQNKGKEVYRKMHHVNLICGPSNLDKVPVYIEKIKKEKKRIIDLEHRKRDESFYKSFSVETQNFASVRINHAQVIISVGCSNYCSYCVVPYVRGDLYLRSPEDIIEEVQNNADLGIKKVTLLGQNVNDYQFERTTDDGRRTTINFVDLLRKITEIEGIEEIDFVTNNPKNTSSDLFNFMAQSPKIKKHLHLPFQSGSDRILELMNRGYSRQDYLNIVGDYKKIVEGSLGTDVIVGFPGETEEDFLQTKDVLERVKFKNAFIFKYSPRPGTVASKLEDDVPEKVKAQRHKILLDLQKKISKQLS
jgi:tRNA-2-methylthio-N6-dimethylallyladenosine synthase